MAYTHSITQTWSNSTAAQVSGTLTATGDREDHLTIVLPDSTDGQEIDIGWTNSKLQALFLLSNRAVTLFSNVDGGAGNDTVSLLAGVPLLYVAGSNQTNPFATANVTKLYGDNASGGSATVEIRVLVDSTP